MNVSGRKQLLKRYEPILRFSGGEHEERFYPVRIQDYLARCTLWEAPEKPKLFGLIPLGRLGGFRARQEHEWDRLSTGQARAEALARFPGYDYFLRFHPEKLEPERPEAAKPDRTNPVAIGCAIILLLTVCLGLAWGSAAVGLDWLGGIWVAVAIVVLALSAFSMFMDWADREFPIGIAQALKNLAAAILVTAIVVPAATMVAWWLGGAGWGVLALAISGLALLGFWTLYLLLAQSDQLLSLVLAIISPVKKRVADDAAHTCQGMPPAYYGRVHQKGQETVLQYFFFYALNDWPRHGGSNYHQGDWEAVLVYLENQGDKQPPALTHVGFSAHHKGQAWERQHVDMELIGQEEHPAVYVAAGSHANYHTSGETPFPETISTNRQGWAYRIASALLRWRKQDHEIGKDLADRTDEARRRRGLNHCPGNSSWSPPSSIMETAASLGRGDCQRSRSSSPGPMNPSFWTTTICQAGWRNIGGCGGSERCTRTYQGRRVPCGSGSRTSKSRGKRNASTGNRRSSGVKRRCRRRLARKHEGSPGTLRSARL